MIVITSRIDGFRRCGVAHPAAPTPHPDDRFDDQQLAILRAEPMLTVVEKEDEPAKPEGDRATTPEKSAEPDKPIDDKESKSREATGHEAAKGGGKK